MDISSDYLEQLEHERMKAWMLEHGWSIAFSCNPEEIYLLIEEHGDESDFDDLDL